MLQVFFLKPQAGHSQQPSIAKMLEQSIGSNQKQGYGHKLRFPEQALPSLNKESFCAEYIYPGGDDGSFSHCQEYQWRDEVGSWPSYGSLALMAVPSLSPFCLQFPLLVHAGKTFVAVRGYSMPYLSPMYWLFFMLPIYHRQGIG